ncbi:hypothetical protein C8Q75DRAFT_117005 [Abortiporus biennis]|nr:hypothetical protein C8Q75DRAFT_117005 [Abortiporus biennis]
MAAAAAAVLSHIDLNTTIGVGFVGANITSMLFGITCLQAVQYYRSDAAQNDRFLWYYVSGLTLLDITHQVFILQTFYHYTITHYDDPVALLKNYPLIGASLLLTPLSDFYCQMFYIWRIWRLSNRHKYWTGFCLLIGLTHLSFNLDMPIKTLKIPELLVAETSLENLGISSLSLTCFKELVYVSTLCYLLIRSRTGFKKTDSIITKLIVIVISTGGFTIAVDIAGLVSYIVAPTTLFVFMFQMLIPKLLINAVLTSLNLRGFVQKLTRSNNNSSFQMNSLIPSMKTKLYKSTFQSTLVEPEIDPKPMPQVHCVEEEHSVRKISPGHLDLEYNETSVIKFAQAQAEFEDSSKRDTCIVVGHDTS